MATAASINLPEEVAAAADGNVTPVALAGATVLLCGLVLLTWSASMGGDFQFDDYGAIVNDSKVRQLWPLDDFITHNRPIGLYTFALNFAAGGLDPSGYHAVNLLIHLAASIVLLCLVRSVLTLPQFACRGWTPTAALWTAWCCAAVWAVHPLTTQAVTYIVQRYESLAALFGLVVLFCQTQAATGRRWWIVPAGVAAWAGVLSKEPMAMMPLVALAFDWAVLQGGRVRQNAGEPGREEGERSRVLATAATDETINAGTKGSRWPFYLVMASSWLWFAPSVSRWIIPDPTRNSSMGFNLKTITPWEYLRTEPEVLLHYLRLSFWPDELCLDYTWRVQHSPAVYLPLGGVILVIAWLGIWWTLKRRPAGFLLLAPLLYLAPTSSFLPIADPAFEHRMYLPLAAIVTGTVGGASLLIRRGALRMRLPVAVLAVPVLLAVLLPLAQRTHLRNLDYRSGLSLWAATLETRPDNPRAHYMLGQELLERGRVEEARSKFADAIAIGIPAAEFHVGMGDCQRDLGQPDEALASYRKAIRLEPELRQAHNGLGVVLHREGDLTAARDAFQTAADLGLPEARYNLAAALIDLGEDAAAIPHLETSLADHPQFERPARRLAWIHATSSNESLLDGERALRILADHCQVEESQSAVMWDTYAAALARVGRFAEAVTAAERALELAEATERDELREKIARRRESYSAGRSWQQTGEDD
ncbi:MAG: tetratricopeptide repeat protein [Planctomycetaceae bacterium]|nr:tetratricopeptide repeat protein [Planctomycetaceae bacterium]